MLRFVSRRPRVFPRFAAGIVLLTLGWALPTAAGPAQDGEAEPGGREVAERWFRLVDALDGSEESRTAFLALYAEDALHIQGPAGDHQRGSATYWGREKVGLLVDRLLEEWKDHSIRPEVATAAEVSEAVWAEADGPWGGPLVAAQFTIAATRREEETRWYIPGAAFFRVRGNELVRVRIYLALGEAAEVEIQR